MHANRDDPRDHLEHLPGRSYLLVVAVASVAVLIVAFSQLTSSSQDVDTLLWGVVLIVATLSIIALAVAWEERRAHLHAVVRQVVDASAADDAHARQVAMAELLRLGAHREIEFLQAGTAEPN